ncbi:MAG: sigma-70 family RNA polymerase sigma factor [Verrucomicrobiota bacterium]
MKNILVNDELEFDETYALQLARAGKKEGWELLHAHYYRGIWAAVKQIVHDDNLAEDVVQEAFLKAFRKLHLFRGKSKFSTWLYRIACNQAYDVMRKAGRRQKWLGLFPLISDDEETEIEAVDPHTAADEAQGQDLQKRITWAIDQLNQEQRAVVELRLIQGFSTEETAKMLGCKKGTVLSRLYYSCQKLKSLLGEEYDEL